MDVLRRHPQVSVLSHDIGVVYGRGPKTTLTNYINIFSDIRFCSNEAVVYLKHISSNENEGSASSMAENVLIAQRK